MKSPKALGAVERVYLVANKKETPRGNCAQKGMQVYLGSQHIVKNPARVCIKHISNSFITMHKIWKINANFAWG